MSGDAFDRKDDGCRKVVVTPRGALIDPVQ
jgi:hypothetical protein